MNYLLDTHVLLWIMTGDKRVDPAMLDKIEDPRATVYISNASLWEIVIKMSIGKLKLNCSLFELRDYLLERGFHILEFDFNDLHTLEKLPFLHQDPFDRMIIAQAKSKELELMTNDRQVASYL
ncbi:MAG: PIN domain-containing protein [Flavobacteriales bacterium]|nr:PIN domain-containing protein [Flavobacteriales bacterium]